MNIFAPKFPRYLIDRYIQFDSFLSTKASGLTKNFVQTKWGKIFLLLILVGPLTFAPTVWEAFTAPNIDVLRTLTWPCMLVVNTASYISLSHNGDKIMRLTILLWMVMITLICIAIVIR